MLPGRTLHSIVKQFYSSIVKVSRAKVITIEPAQNALTMEQVVKLFTTAFEQICALEAVNRFVVSSLTHELTSAEVMTVFHRRNKRSGGASRTLT
jgi:hypothetical protein